MRDDNTDRAASIAITHTLTIAITAMLITGLLLSTGGFLERQQNRVARQQMHDITGDVTSLIHGADQLNETGKTVSVTLDPSYPETITGNTYTLALVPDPGDPTSGTLYLNMSRSGLSVEQKISTRTTLNRSFLSGEDPTISLCPGAGGADQEIRLGRCS